MAQAQHIMKTVFKFKDLVWGGGGGRVHYTPLGDVFCLWTRCVALYGHSVSGREIRTKVGREEAAVT